MLEAAPTWGTGHRSRDVLRLHLAVAGFGFAGVFGKLIGLPPVTIVAGRAGFAALAIAIIFMVRSRSLDLLPRSGRDFFSLSLGLLLAVHWFTFFQAVQVATVGIALVSFSMAPILLLGMEAVWRRRWPGPRPALASLVAMLGVLAVTPVLHWSNASVKGVVWGIASGGTYALLVLLNRPMVVARLSPWRIAMWQNAVAALALAPFVALQSGPPTPGEWGLLALLGIVFTAGTHGLFLQSIRSVPAHVAVLTSTLEPGYGILAAICILGEWPALRTLLGAAIIAAAVAYTTYHERVVAPLNGGPAVPGSSAGG